MRIHQKASRSDPIGRTKASGERGYSCVYVTGVRNKRE